MSERRLHCPELPAAGTFWLDGAEAHHLLHVLRAGDGDACRVFDGHGREVRTRIVRTERGRALLEVGEEIESARPPRAVTLLTAVPRGKRMEWLVEKCTEAGVARIVTVGAARSVRKETGGNTLRRWRAAAVAAAKQCGRAEVPEVAAPVPLADALATWGDAPIFVATLEAPASLGAALDAALGAVRDSELLLGIGPEGGFTDEESALLAARGARPFAMGDLVLRIETAAAIAVHAAVWR